MQRFGMIPHSLIHGMQPWKNTRLDALPNGRASQLTVQQQYHSISARGEGAEDVLKISANQSNGLSVKHFSHGQKSDKHSSGGELDYEGAEADDQHARKNLPKETPGNATISHGTEYRVSIPRSNERATRLGFLTAKSLLRPAAESCVFRWRQWNEWSRLKHSRLRHRKYPHFLSTSSAKVRPPLTSICSRAM